jgi:uncharacterized protein YabN with tetrapyrrole methylase and pyrophosphatase domain
MPAPEISKVKRWLRATRSRLVEKFAGERGLDHGQLTLERLDALWDEAKATIADRDHR